MSEVQYAVIDAFTDTAFSGNPAAVCLLEESKDTEWMQKVAAEFNLSETAFLRRRENAHHNGNAVDRDAKEFDLRWFTPETEIDAFTGTAFSGNPAAVCLLEENKDTEWMQKVAAEFNLSDTAFLRRRENAHHNGNAVDNDAKEFDLRWFTPETEVDLCGHATLASAHFLFSTGLVNCNLVLFHTRSGVLTALKIEGFNKEGQSFGRIELDFPQVSVLDCDSSDISLLSNSLKGLEVHSVKKTTYDDLFIELASGEQVQSLQPQFEEICKCSCRGVIVTGIAPKKSGFDFYSRFFCPKLGINEDPVCGSAHCALGPYWATKLGKTQLVAYQASKRGGKLVLHVAEDKKHVFLQGEAVKVMSGILSS